MRALIAPLEELSVYQSLFAEKNEKTGFALVTGCISSQKNHMMYGLSAKARHTLAIVGDESAGRELCEELATLGETIFFYPPQDFLFQQVNLKNRELSRERMKVLHALLNMPKVTVVTTLEGCMESLPSLEELRKMLLHVSKGGQLDFEVMQSRLVQLGYTREEEVQQPGEFAVRGGIMDLYPVTEEMPVRIELWGDEVESVRTFEVENQRSIRELERVTVFPVRLENEAEKKGVSLLTYFDTVKDIVVLHEPARAFEQLRKLEEEIKNAGERRKQGGKDLAFSLPVIFSEQEIQKQFHSRAVIGFTAFHTSIKEQNVREIYSVQTRSVPHYHGKFSHLVQELKKRKQEGYRVILLSGSKTRARRLAEELQKEGLASFYSEDGSRMVSAGEIMVSYGYCVAGYEYPGLKFMVIAETDIFGRLKKKSHKKSGRRANIQDFSQLIPGDYVVHENHGIGIYEGMEQLTVDKITKDYLKISYANGAKLYILVSQVELLQKYTGAGEGKPKLDRLGGVEWSRTKRKVKAAVSEIAEDLVALYANRQGKEGFVYGKDTVWQKEFEELFPFEETEDQLQAIAEIKEDMESPRIMDRLLCGDVGYGKTEVAMRIAFKAVQENRQVAYLAPTTILAQQHYNTFAERFRDYPVRMELLCRFCSKKQMEQIVEDTAKGLVDILIGTHRILSKDVAFKNLGLLIIDEEQRFGVRHKEKIKQLRNDVDVLTLTATPIPRTLHMSLIGIRDLSILQEAPKNRMPIQTYVMEYDDEMIREAIERELKRDGQVYYVYNQIRDIEEMAEHLRTLVPKASVSYAHGQMPVRQLERIMYEFISGEIDVLVSTTIIDTGLDISNVNTMLVHDADRMGLAQLYQLRGRVGRSDKTAYAFLLYRREKLLQETAEKRLFAIRDFTKPGSGFQIAMRDLEIRGAGNLLGQAQHGHMAAVGYDLYCKLLGEAVSEQKGEKKEERFYTAVDLSVDAYLPADYIDRESLRLEIYKRLALLSTEEEIRALEEELTDRFGEPPIQANLLLQLTEIKILAHSAYVTTVEQTENKYRFVMYEKADVRLERLPQFLATHVGEISFKAKPVPCFWHERKHGKQIAPEKSLVLVKNILSEIKWLIE